MILTNCGSIKSDNKQNTEDVKMKIGTTYIIFSQNKIIKNKTNSLLKISHKHNEFTSNVVLLSGAATILRNPK